MSYGGIVIALGGTLFILGGKCLVDCGKRAFCRITCLIINLGAPGDFIRQAFVALALTRERAAKETRQSTTKIKSMEAEPTFIP